MAFSTVQVSQAAPSLSARSYAVKSKPSFTGQPTPVDTFEVTHRQQYDRKLGEFTQNKTGPLFILIGAIHGNEPAGVKAIETVLSELNEEFSEKPFNGKVVGLVGNLRAFQAGKRTTGVTDLNRAFTPENMDALKRGIEPKTEGGKN